MGATATVEAARQRKTEAKVLVHHRRRRRHHHHQHEHQEEEEDQNLHHIDNHGTPTFSTLAPSTNTTIILR